MPRFHKKNAIILFLLFLSLITYPTIAQELGNSPYSRAGIGDLFLPSTAQQNSMAGAGVSFSESFYVNQLNPALLARNKTTIFEVGIIGRIKLLEATNGNQRDFGGSMHYLSIALPVNRFWTTSFGLTPYSSVKYDNEFRQTIANSTFRATYTQQGRGGMNKIYFANGFEVVKNLYVGIKANYLFGNIQDESITELFTNTTQDLRIAFKRNNQYNGFLIEPAIAYRHKIKNDVYFNIGLNYSLNSTIQAKTTEIVERRTLDDTPVIKDTVTNGAAQNITLPSQLRVGVSLNKSMHWAFMADVTLQDWTQFKSFDPDTLRNTFSVHIGAEFTPEYDALKGYHKRLTYKAGFKYAQSPISVNGVPINDMAISFGAALPLARGLTIVNIGTELGTRGTIDKGLIRENYITFYLGTTINDKWFIKRKID
ncbi:MAG: hypothetical protein EAZ55_05265 [Cytophagales bacterium]|nr:MAG: hypothetical protein EAZ55_05265 [Cytophagales bacterium]